MYKQGINTEIQISRAETSLKKEIKIKRYKENKRREAKKLSEEGKENFLKIEERTLKTGDNAQNYYYEAMFRTNAELDKHSKERKKANLFPENQSISEFRETIS